LPPRFVFDSRELLAAIALSLNCLRAAIASKQSIVLGA
jgi:hypothetical protein